MAGFFLKNSMKQIFREDSRLAILVPLQPGLINSLGSIKRV